MLVISALSKTRMDSHAKPKDKSLLKGGLIFCLPILLCLLIILISRLVKYKEKYRINPKLYKYFIIMVVINAATGGLYIIWQRNKWQMFIYSKHNSPNTRTLSRYKTKNLLYTIFLIPVFIVYVVYVVFLICCSVKYSFYKTDTMISSHNNAINEDLSLNEDDIDDIIKQPNLENKHDQHNRKVLKYFQELKQSDVDEDIFNLKTSLPYEVENYRGKVKKSLHKKKNVTCNGKEQVKNMLIWLVVTSDGKLFIFRYPLKNQIITSTIKEN